MKGWAQPIAAPDNWMDVPPDVSAVPCEGAEAVHLPVGELDGGAVEQHIEAQIANFAQSIEKYEGALKLDDDLTRSLGELQENLHELAEMRHALEAGGNELSDEAREGLLRLHQDLLNRGSLMGPAWLEWMESQPVFEGIVGRVDIRSSRAQRRKSSEAKRRKRRRR
jgi:hypothetical protein